MTDAPRPLSEHPLAKRYLTDTLGLSDEDADEVLWLLTSDEPAAIMAMQVGIGELLEGLA